MCGLNVLLFVMLGLHLNTVQSKNTYIPTEAEEIIHFCQNNGKDFLTITTKDFDDLKVGKNSILKKILFK